MELETHLINTEMLTLSTFLLPLLNTGYVLHLLAIGMSILW